MNWKAWGQGLIVAILSAGFDAASTGWVDPGVLTDPAKLQALGIKTAFMAVGAALLYLKTHPTPQE